MRSVARTTAIGFCLLFQGVSVLAAGPKISDMGAMGDNKHNLSSAHSRTAGYKADPSDPRGNQICVFCHTPHHAGQIALWNRNDSGAIFGHYSSPTLVIRRTSNAQYGEPTGSSRPPASASPQSYTPPESSHRPATPPDVCPSPAPSEPRRASFGPPK